MWLIAYQPRTFDPVTHRGGGIRFTHLDLLQYRQQVRHRQQVRRQRRDLGSS